MASRLGRFRCWGAALLALPLGGCSDSGGPTRPPVVADYSSPTHALETLAQAIEDKGRTNGMDLYLGALAESTAADPGDGRAYHAFFDSRDLLESPGWDRDWDRSLERVVYADLTLKYPGPFDLTWEPYEPLGNETGTANDSLLHRKYRIVQLVRGVRAPVAVGAAELYFVRSNRNVGRWVIARWQDYRTIDADSANITLGRRRLSTQ